MSGVIRSGPPRSLNLQRPRKYRGSDLVLWLLFSVPSKLQRRQENPRQPTSAASLLSGRAPPEIRGAIVRNTITNSVSRNEPTVPSPQVRFRRPPAVALCRCSVPLSDAKPTDAPAPAGDTDGGSIGDFGLVCPSGGVGAQDWWGVTVPGKVDPDVPVHFVEIDVDGRAFRRRDRQWGRQGGFRSDRISERNRRACCGERR